MFVVVCCDLGLWVGFWGNLLNVRLRSVLVCCLKCVGFLFGCGLIVLYAWFVLYVI